MVFDISGNTLKPVKENGSPEETERWWDGLSGLYPGFGLRFLLWLARRSWYSKNLMDGTVASILDLVEYV